MMDSVWYATSRLVKVLVAGLAVLGFAVLVLAAAAAAPAIEQRYFPPFASIKILRFKWLDSRRVEIFTEIEKTRPCKFVELNWYQLNPAINADGKAIFLRERIPLRFEDRDDDTPYSRPVGENIAGPWILFVPPDSPPLHMASSRHDCGFSWDSASEPPPINMTAILKERPP